MSIPRRPYKITALGHFKPDPDPRESTRPIPVDLYTIDQALAKIKPRMSINVDRGQCPGGFLDLQLEALGHFKPDHLIGSQPYLKRLADARRQIADSLASGRSARSIKEQVQSICPDLPIDLTIDREAGPVRKETDPLASIFSMVSVPREGAGRHGSRWHPRWRG